MTSPLADNAASDVLENLQRLLAASISDHESKQRVFEEKKQELEILAEEQRMSLKENAQKERELATLLLEEKCRADKAEIALVNACCLADSVEKEQSADVFNLESNILALKEERDQLSARLKAEQEKDCLVSTYIFNNCLFVNNLLPELCSKAFGTSKFSGRDRTLDA